MGLITHWWRTCSWGLRDVWLSLDALHSDGMWAKENCWFLQAQPRLRPTGHSWLLTSVLWSDFSTSLLRDAQWDGTQGTCRASMHQWPSKAGVTTYRTSTLFWLSKKQKEWWRPKWWGLLTLNLQMLLNMLLCAVTFWDRPGRQLPNLTESGKLFSGCEGSMEHMWGFLSGFFFFNFLFFWPGRAARKILVPQLGIKPVPPALETWSLSHWTTREVSCLYFFIIDLQCCVSFRRIAQWFSYIHTYIYIHMYIGRSGIVVQLSRVRLWFRTCLYPVKKGWFYSYFQISFTGTVVDFS